MSHQQKTTVFEPSQTLWQTENAAPAILTSSCNLQMHSKSKDEAGSAQLQQLTASSVSQATSACSAGGKQHFVQLRKKEAPSRDAKGCLHAELISYKVHKDQFKSLLIPLMKHQKKVVDAKGSGSGRRNHRNKAAAKTQDFLKSDGQMEPAARAVGDESKPNERASSRNP